jgi:hypothetical protein
VQRPFWVNLYGVIDILTVFYIILPTIIFKIL